MKNIFSLVIPVYFNEETLLQLFEKILIVEKELHHLGVDLDLIFIDDGSKDKSLSKLLEIKKKRDSTKIIKLSKNFGANQAIKCALEHIKGNCFMALAADLQDPPELISSMVEKWISGSKLIICQRRTRKDPFFTKFFASIYYKIIRTVVMKNYPKSGYDMALMDKIYLKYILNSSKGLYIPLLVPWLGIEPEVIFYDRPKRPYGSSKWTFSKKLNVFFDTVFGFTVFPMRLLSGIGFFTSLLSFLYGINIILNAIFGNIPVAGYATIVVLISFLLGLVIMMLGLIGEYIWRIYEEVNKRPSAVIEEIF